mmetsp:Transcript_15654/g.30907  ORF Transcript_15654/g.30907 Transcript_15654/m.30907 type:complete len:761 (+) Transcript_15654:56-2338(+)
MDAREHAEKLARQHAEQQAEAMHAAGTGGFVEWTSPGGGRGHVLVARPQDLAAAGSASRWLEMKVEQLRAAGFSGWLQYLTSPGEGSLRGQVHVSPPSGVAAAGQVPEQGPPSGVAAGGLAPEQRPLARPRVQMLYVGDDSSAKGDAPSSREMFCRRIQQEHRRFGLGAQVEDTRQSEGDASPEDCRCGQCGTEMEEREIREMDDNERCQAGGTGPVCWTCSSCRQRHARMEATRALVKDILRAVGHVEHIVGVGPEGLEEDYLHRDRQCRSCGKGQAFQRCPCKVAYYCDAKCQQKGWAGHRPSCTVDLEKRLDKEMVLLQTDVAEERQSRQTDGPGPRLTPQEHRARCLQLAQKMLHLGGVWMRQDLLKHAAQWTESAVVMCHVLEDDSGMPVCDVVEDVSAHVVLCQGLGQLCSVYLRLGQTGRAHAAALELGRMAQQHVHEGRDSAQAAEALRHQGACWVQRGMYAEAHRTYGEAVDMMLRVLPDDGYEGNGVDSKCMLETMLEFASLEWRLDRLSLAEKTYGNVLDLVTDRDDLMHLDLAPMACLGLGTCLRVQGNLDMALKYLNMGLVQTRTNHPERHSHEGQFLEAIANVYADKGSKLEAEGGQQLNAYDKAVTMYTKAVRIFERTVGPGSVEIARVFGHMSELWWLRGRGTEALQAIQHSVEIFSGQYASFGHQEFADALYQMGYLLHKTGKDQWALETLRRAVEVYAEVELVHGGTPQGNARKAGALTKLLSSRLQGRGGGRAREATGGSG